mgnify:CR=1 FL=1
MTSEGNITADDIINFWFKEITPKQWWIKDNDFDNQIKNRFKDLYTRAAASELVRWRSTPLSSLAEIIVLDQFPRNMFRDTPAAFTTDPLAVCLTQVAIDKGFDQQLDSSKKSFMYMPLMHSESPEVHKLAENVFSAPGLENNYDFELKHKAIIDRFGRYPHRNEVLGRPSTKAEIDFLKEPNSSF